MFPPSNVINTSAPLAGSQQTMPVSRFIKSTTLKLPKILVSNTQSNPANKNINIKVATPEYYQVEFYNLLGEHVLTFPTQYFSSLELDISILTSGVYNVQLNSLQNRFHGKFVKF